MRGEVVADPVQHYVSIRCQEDPHGGNCQGTKTAGLPRSKEVAEIMLGQDATLFKTVWPPAVIRSEIKSQDGVSSATCGRLAPNSGYSYRLFYIQRGLGYTPGLTELSLKGMSWPAVH